MLGLFRNVVKRSAAPAASNARAISSTAALLRENGTVKWFNSPKGFGFIKPDGASDHQNDIFVHYSDIVGDGFKMLEEGLTVEFDVAKQPDGRTRAIEVTKPGGEVIVPLPREHSDDYSSRW